MFDKSENFSLSIYLNKPKEKWDIIPCIESMPKCADHENPKLGHSSSSERRSLINAFSKPLLNSDVPMGNFISDVFIAFNNNWTACIDQFEFFTIITDTTCMDASNTQFPSKVIFEPNKSDANKRVKQNIKCVMFIKFISFHVWCWRNHLPSNVDTCANQTVSDCDKSLFNSVWKIIIRFL